MTPPHLGDRTCDEFLEDAEIEVGEPLDVQRRLAHLVRPELRQEFRLVLPLSSRYWYEPKPTMLGPHIFGCAPVTLRSMAINDLQSVACASLAREPM